MPKPLDQKTFIDRARQVHGDRYDYSQTVYLSYHQKLTIICPEHGPFEQTPASHLAGHGCPDCKAAGARERFRSPDKFLARARAKHGDRYDYSKVEYSNNCTPVTIICPEHGPFEQQPQHHARGSGCPICGRLAKSGSRNSKHRDAACSFIDRARQVHGDRYDYSEVRYNGAMKPVTIVCPDHGPFEQTPNNHINQPNGCPKCAHNVSRPEMELQQFVEGMVDSTQVRFNRRDLIYPYELDIVIPGKQIAVEFNGTVWHSELFKKDNNYHKKKTERCLARGYQLIHISEYDWTNRRDLVKGMLTAKLGHNHTKVGARQCEVVRVGCAEAKQFLCENHMQGYTAASTKLGLRYKGKLVMLMTFGRPRFNSKYKYELLRLCSASGFTVVGGASRLFTHFVRAHAHKGDRIVSYANRAWSNGDVYQHMGFKFEGVTRPNYTWYSRKNNQPPLSRYKCQKGKLQGLLQDQFDSNKSETENMHNAGFFRVYDAGNLVLSFVVG
jgi:very-short-patch-repair endonuclease